jgi:Flp pilus assembly protein TadG
MIRRRRSEFGRDQRGGVAIFFGFALPVLLVGAGAAVEYASLTHRRGQLQKAADTAALTAARELTLANADDARVKSVAQGAAIASLTEGKQGGTSATVAAEVMDKRGGVRVTIHETITNIFGKVLTLPSSELEVRAAAKLSGGGRLCVMALDPTKGEAIRLDQNAKLTANGCSVQSNSKDRKGISAREYAFLSAERICSAGGYEGLTATQMGRVLRGANPAELPIEQPTRFELVVNARTAKILGLGVPPSFVMRADEIIE